LISSAWASVSAASHSMASSLTTSGARALLRRQRSATSRAMPRVQAMNGREKS